MGQNVLKEKTLSRFLREEIRVERQKGSVESNKLEKYLFCTWNCVNRVSPLRFSSAIIRYVFSSQQKLLICDKIK